MMQRNLPQAPVLAADTTVALGTRILGKPADRKQAAAILAELSGQTHQVLSAVALKQADWLESSLSVSDVRFKPLTEQEIQQYVASGEGDVLLDLLLGERLGAHIRDRERAYQPIRQ